MIGAVVLDWARSEILRAAWRRGWYQPPDRRLLAGTILPALADDSAVARVLFVGVHWYNAGQGALFASRGKVYATIDPDPAQASYGGRPHAIGSVQEVERHLAGVTFDAVVMTGVIGWGIDDRAGLHAALQACARVVRPGAWLVLGVNPGRPTHVEPEDAAASAGFAPAVLPPFTTSRVDVPVPFGQKLHSYRFWRKSTRG